MSRPLTVFLVSDTMATLAGTEHSVTMAATALAERGHRVYLAAFSVDGPVHPVWMSRLTRAGVAVHDVAPGPQGVETVAELIEAAAPDILHAIPMESLVRNFIEVARGYGQAAVLGTMTSDPSDTNFWYEDLDASNLRRYDLIVSPSALLAERLRQVRGADLKTVVVPHIIPEPRPIAETGHWRLDADQLARAAHLGAVTRLREEKGPDFLLAAFAMVARARPDARLSVYGELTELDRARHVAQAFAIADRVSWSGPFDGPSQIDAIMHKHAIFLLPSLFESMPISLMEAQSRGRLCVAFDVGAVAELFDRTGSGRTVAVGDTRAMADAVLEYLSLDIAELGVQTMAGFHRAYSAWAAVDALEQAYRHALAHR